MSASKARPALTYRAARRNAWRVAKKLTGESWVRFNASAPKHVQPKKLRAR